MSVGQSSTRHDGEVIHGDCELELDTGEMLALDPSTWVSDAVKTRPTTVTPWSSRVAALKEILDRKEDGKPLWRKYRKALLGGRTLHYAEWAILALALPL
jgi:hypothetical protein